MTRAVQSVVPGSAPSLKWPNDVLVRGRKVCGILAELLPGGDGVIVGAGVNLTIPEDALPVPTATSCPRFRRTSRSSWRSSPSSSSVRPSASRSP